MEKDIMLERRREALYRAQHSGLSRREVIAYRIWMTFLALGVLYFIIRIFV